MPGEQLLLFPDDEPPADRLFRVAVAVGEMLLHFQLGWFTYADWARSYARCRRETHKTSERRWNRLLVDLDELHVPHERKTSDVVSEAHNTGLLRMTRATLEWHAGVFPSHFDEPTDDLTWEELEDLLHSEQE